MLILIGVLLVALGLGIGLRLRQRRISIGGGGANAVNTIAPAITGTRGGTLTATPGTWTGATSVSGQWYADGVATGNTTTSFTDSDTSKSLEYRETALPGSVVAKGFKGAYVDPPQAFADNFDDNSKNTSLWGANGPFIGSVDVTTGGTVNETNQRLEVTPQANTAGNGNGYISTWTFDFTGASLTVSMTVVSTLSGAAIPYFGIGADANNGYQIELNGGTLCIAKIKAGTASLVATGPVFDPVAHKFQRLRHGGSTDDTFYLDTSPDGTTWTQRVSVARDAAVAITNAKIALGNFVWASSAAPGTIAFDNLTTTAAAVSGPTANIISSAVINAQPSTAPGNKQIDFTATINAVGATGAQYKIETEAGELVQGWTSATFSGGTASGTALLSRFAYEGQKLKVLVRNVGGTVNTAAKLTATNGYVMSTPMLVGINDGNSWAYYENQIPGRDWFTNAHLGWGIIAANPTTADRQGIMAAGMVADNYQGWAQPYNAATAYPTTSGTNDHDHCRYQGLSWKTTDTTSKVRAAPSTANLSGSGADWKLASDGPADASLVNLNGDGMPTKLPDDTNLTLYFEQAWSPPTANAPFTVACKTQPGIAFKMWNASLGNLTLTQSPADIAAGQFTLNYGTPNLAQPQPYNGQLIIDRANCTATLDSTFFLSGIASYETGTPSADIGSPYMSAMKSADFDPFAGARYVKPLPIEKQAGFWTGTWTAANNTLGGTTFWLKYIVDTANRLGHKYVHINIPWPADASYVTAIATYLRDNLNPGILIFVEKSNEDWNNQYLNYTELNERAAALNPADAAYNKPYLLHCREHNAMVASFKTVFGAAYASRVQPVLAWQSVTSVSQWQEMLDSEDTWRNVGRCSIAPYVDSGVGDYTASPNTAWAQDALQAAVGLSDQATFNTKLNTFMSNATDYEVGLAKALFDFLPGYSISKGLSKNAIQMLYYEGGWFITKSTAGWDGAYGAGAGTRAISYFDQWKRSSTGGGAFFARYLDQLAQKAPGAINCFVYVGGSNSWGIADGMGKTTQEPMATILTKCAAYNV